MLEIIFPKIHKEGKKILTITLSINFFVFFISETLGLLLIILIFGFITFLEILIEFL